MKRYFFSIAVILFSMHGLGQRSIDSMVQTEKKFANTSMVVSTSEALIEFIDTAGIVFDKGKPVNGLHLYRNREKRPGILTWEPEYSEIASTNDFGYTTGPWKFYQNNPKDNPVATGYFVTVWHLTNHGDWKFLIDFGINCTNEGKKTSLKKRQAGDFKSDKDKENSQSLNQAEEKFIEIYYSQGDKAYKSFLSEESRLNYTGFLPATNQKEREVLLDSLPAKINYTTVGSGMSPAKDMGYVYGTAVINGKQDGYLRIWRKEKDEWKIAVEVLHFK